MDPGEGRVFARIGEVNLHWEEVGSGAPLVLLHGLCDSHRTWLPVAPALARSRRVFMLDLAGHGESSRPDAPYTLDWHANVVGSWLGELGLTGVDLVGHSYGGGVAQWMLLGHRERIRRLALEAPGGLGRAVGVALRWASFPYFVEAFGQPFMAFGTTRALNAAGGAFLDEEIAILAKYNSTPETARAFSRSVRDVINAWGQHRHFLDRAHEVAALPPTALFWGDADPLIPIEHGIEALEVLKGATLTRFAGAGHFPHREQPERFVETLEAFLDAPDLAAPQLTDAGGRGAAASTKASAA
jgi:pimeloyl-ACP methyl ester carboxylesterase